MSKATREVYGEVLSELGEENKDIIVLDADLSKATKTDTFKKKYPERFFDLGIAEADMLGTAAGLATTGKIPFASSFAVFMSRELCFCVPFFTNCDTFPPPYIMLSS